MADLNTGSPATPYERKRRSERYHAEAEIASPSAAEQGKKPVAKRTISTASKPSAASAKDAAKPVARQSAAARKTHPAQAASQAAQHYPSMSPSARPQQSTGTPNFGGTQGYQPPSWPAPGGGTQGGFYPPQPNAWQQNGYNTQGYPPQQPSNGYGTQGYPPQPRYTPGGEYPPQQRYAPQGGFGTQGYPPQGGYSTAPNTVTPPPKPPQAEVKSRFNWPGRKRPAINPLTRWLVGALAVLVVVCAVVATVTSIQTKRRREALEAEVALYDARYCQGVYVDGIHLGGLSQDAAMQLVTQQAQSKRDAWSVQLRFEGETLLEIGADQLGMTVNVQDALAEAWAQGHQGDALTRKAAMDQLRQTPYQAWSTMPSGDTTVIDTMLEQVAEQMYIAPQDAQVAEFNAALSNPFTFADEVVGRSLDVAPVKEKIYQMLSGMDSGAIELEPTYTHPQVTAEELKKTMVTQRATATTDISTTSGEGRNNNIRLAFQHINGTVLQPGDTFSFNDIVGERTLKNGFSEAPEYTYGQEVPGVGGGVCQASTTVYQAAVRAGLEIVRRDPHGLEVRYAPYGTDATVSSTRGHEIDLRFRNNTSYPIYIKAGVESKEGNRKRLVTRVTIYGEYLGDGVRYDFDTEEEILPAPVEPEYVVDKKGEYAIYEDETYVYREAKDGLKVVSYQVKYVGDEIKERTYLDTDTYDPKSQIIYVGVTPREELIW